MSRQLAQDQVDHDQVDRVPAGWRDLALLPAGFVIWSSAFVALYGFSGLGCALGWDQRMLGPVTLMRAGLLLIWLAHIIAGAALVLWAKRRPPSRSVLFGSGVVALSAASLVATVGTGAPTMILALCR